MKLDFMTWVITNTTYTVVEINDYWFRIEELKNEKSDIWISKDGLEIDDPKLAHRAYYEIKSFKYPPERWTKIIELLDKYHGGADETEFHDVGND